MKPVDLRVSQRMQKIMRKVTNLIQKEVGAECFVAVLIQPWDDDLKDVPLVQYGSNSDRAFVRDAMAALVEKWDAEGGVVHTPPHDVN